MNRAALLLGVLALGAPGGGLAAQGRRAQQRGTGFWFGLGAASGWARLSCAICAGNRDPGPSLVAALGGRTSPGLRLGAELAGWRRTDGAVTQTVTTIGGVAYWFPGPRRRFFLKGGATYVSHRGADGTDVITSTGIGPLLGFGIELPLEQTWRLAPFFTYSLGALLGEVKVNGGETGDRATVSFVQLGVTLTRP